MDNRTVIVSGGSRGLGLALCQRLLDAGYNVRTFSRTKSPEVQSIEAAYDGSGRYAWHELDATDYDGLTAFVKQTQKDSGRIWALVNNAGINLDRLLPMTRAEDISRVISVNLESVMLLSQLVSRNMITGNGGCIINISSVIGYRGIKGTSVYAATKSALLGFTRSLARELGPRGIRVNAVLPGYIDTDMTHEMVPEKRNQVLRRTPLGRFGVPDDIAGVTEFLLSPEANYLTGQAIAVDGGLTC